MEKFELIVFLTLKGIGATSGLVNTNNSLYLISDSSNYLYEYSFDAKQLNKIPLVENAQDNIPKKQKADFEAITEKDGKLFLFGSGSTENRNKNFSFDVKNRKIEENDLTGLYGRIKKQFSIPDDELNIEGALYADNHLLLFQRGNGANTKNGIVKIGHKLGEMDFTPIQLPKIKHVETSFTDAILVNDKIYFLASAEDTNSTYEDGEVLGSIIGIIDSKTLQLEKTLQISEVHKFEGLTLFKSSEQEIEFLLCEDNDSEELTSFIYKLKINK